MAWAAYQTVPFLYLFINYNNLSMLEDFKKLALEGFYVWIVIWIAERIFDFLATLPESLPFVVQLMALIIILLFILNHCKNNGNAWECLRRRYVSSGLYFVLAVRFTSLYPGSTGRGFGNAFYFIGGSLILWGLVIGLHGRYTPGQIIFFKQRDIKDIPPK